MSNSEKPHEERERKQIPKDTNKTPASIDTSAEMSPDKDMTPVQGHTSAYDESDAEEAASSAKR